MKKRILGIDTGTNSLGWAVVERNDDGVYSLLRKGSLIFQEGVKVEKGIESSKAADRTSHRASRKHYFRRRLRKIEVLRVLVKYGWCPGLSNEQLHLWHTKKQYPNSEAFMVWTLLCVFVVFFGIMIYERERGLEGFFSIGGWIYGKS